jgi:MFS family permease
LAQPGLSGDDKVHDVIEPEPETFPVDSPDNGAVALSVRRWLPFITIEGSLANVFIVLTGGAFITALALLFGANDFEIGVLAAIPFLAQIAQLSSAFFVEQIKNRKSVVWWLSVTGRQAWWILLPVLFLPLGHKLEILMLVALFSNVAVMIATPAWLSWMADLIPEKVRARYFGFRSAWLAASTIVSVLVGGVVLDHFKTRGFEITGFAVIVTASCVFAAAAAILLRKIPDKAEAATAPNFSRSHLNEPVKDRTFRHLLFVFLCWNGAIGISAPFFAPHMLTHLQMSFTQISIYSSLAAIGAVVLNRPWGLLIDRFGSKPVVALCAFGIAVIPMIWWFPRAGHLWILAFEAVYSGALWTGFNLAAFNIPIANSPRLRRTIYLAIFSVTTGLGFFAASILGGILAHSIVSFHWQLGPQTIVNYHLIFALSTVLRLGAAFLFLRFHEPK